MDPWSELVDELVLTESLIDNPTLQAHITKQAQWLRYLPCPDDGSSAYHALQVALQHNTSQFNSIQTTLLQRPERTYNPFKQNRGGIIDEWKRQNRQFRLPQGAVEDFIYNQIGQEMALTRFALLKRKLQPHVENFKSEQERKSKLLVAKSRLDLDRLNIEIEEEPQPLRISQTEENSRKKRKRTRSDVFTNWGIVSNDKRNKTDIDIELIPSGLTRSNSSISSTMEKSSDYQSRSALFRLSQLDDPKMNDVLQRMKLIDNVQRELNPSTSSTSKWRTNKDLELPPEKIQELSTLPPGLFDGCYSKTYIRNDIRGKLLRPGAAEKLKHLDPRTVIHVPFDEKERETLFQLIISHYSLENYVNAYQVAKSGSELLPGRSFKDVSDFLSDLFGEKLKSLENIPRLDYVTLLRLSRNGCVGSNLLTIEKSIDQDSYMSSTNLNQKHLLRLSTRRIPCPLSRIQHNYDVVCGDNIITVQFSPAFTNLEHCLVASTQENRSKVMLLDVTSQKQFSLIEFESKWNADEGDAQFSLDGKRVLVTSPEQNIHVMTLPDLSQSDNELDTWTMKELRTKNSDVRKPVRLRSHKSNSDIWFAFEVGGNSPLWSMNTRNRSFSSAFVKEIVDVEPGYNDDELLISTSESLDLYGLDASGLRLKFRIPFGADLGISMIRTPNPPFQNPGMENLLAYTVATANDPFDTIVQFIDIRAIDNVVCTLDYRDAKNFIRSCTSQSGTRIRPPHFVNNMSFSPSGMFFETCGADNCIFVHDMRNLKRFASTYAIFEHELSSITRENVDNEQEQFPYDGVAAEWSSDSRFIVSGADDCHVRVWDMEESSRASVRSIKWDTSKGRTHALSRSFRDDYVAVGTSKGFVSIFSV